MESSSALSTFTAPINTSLSRSSSKVDSLYEISYIPENQKIQDTIPPIVNPYTAFSKSTSSLSKTFKTLVRPSRKPVKEYVQTSTFDKCQIPATSQEQYVTLEIPQESITQWIREGYSHVHFGAIRLALSYHGRKGLPVSVRIALLDTRFVQYQHACIGTAQTTLNAGTVIMTLFPNFNMSLSDVHCSKALKVQLQIVGADLNPGSIAATLHYQMVWRIQDHALDLAIPTTTDALLLTVDSQNTPHCINIPRQISRDDLIKLLPDSWVTSYESLNKKETPVVSTESTMHDNSDGTTTIRFKSPATPSAPPLSFRQTQFMITPVRPTTTVREPGLSIHSFQQSGAPVYHQYDPVTGHTPFDLDCQCSKCRDDPIWEIDEHYLPRRNYFNKKKKKARCSQTDLHSRFEEHDPEVGLLGQPSGKFDYYCKYSPPPRKDSPSSNPSWDIPPKPQPKSPLKLSKLTKSPYFKQPLPCYQQSLRWIAKENKPTHSPLAHTPPVQSVR